MDPIATLLSRRQRAERTPRSRETERDGIREMQSPGRVYIRTEISFGPIIEARFVRRTDFISGPVIFQLFSSTRSSVSVNTPIEPTAVETAERINTEPSGATAIVRDINKLIVGVVLSAEHAATREITGGLMTSVRLVVNDKKRKPTAVRKRKTYATAVHAR